MSTLNPINAADLKRKLEAGEAVLVDIREPNEHAQEHIAEARLAPLSGFDPEALADCRDKIGVFHCKSGMRTRTNAAKLAACGFVEAYFLDGGIEAWKAAGFDVRRQQSAPTWPWNRGKTNGS